MRGGLIETGGLYNLAKTMASVLHKELELQSGKAQVQWLYVMQPRIKNKFERPTWEINTVYHLLVKNNKGRGGGVGAH